MSTVFKRESSPYWFACYVMRTGQSRRRTTKTTDRSVALRMAQEWEHIERLARAGQATVATFQKVVNQVAERVIGDSLPMQSVKQYLEEWVKSSARRTTPRTAERYRNTVFLFLKSLGTVAEQPVRSIGPRHIELFLHRRLDEGLAPQTAIVDIKSLGSAFRRAENYGFIDKNPVPAVKLPKAASMEREVFSLEEIHQLVAAAPNEDWQTLILLGFYLGARLNDCARLTWDNVDADRRLIVYQQQKTGKIVPVPLHPDLLLHLGRLSQKSTIGPLCRSLARTRQAGKSGLSEAFKRIVVRAGLDLMVVKGRGIRKFSRRTFHSLRHSFSSMLASHGVSEEMRMRLTGHSSRDIHQRYTHVNVEALQQAIDAIPVRSTKEPAG